MAFMKHDVAELNTGGLAFVREDRGQEVSCITVDEDGKHLVVYPAAALTKVSDASEAPTELAEGDTVYLATNQTRQMTVTSIEADGTTLCGWLVKGKPKPGRYPVAWLRKEKDTTKAPEVCYPKMP